MSDSSQQDLESKVMFLERTVDALNLALVEQSQFIERLERRVERLEKRVEDKGGGPEVGPHDAPPPHY